MIAKDRDDLDEDDMLRAVGFLTDLDRTLFQDVSPNEHSFLVRWEPTQDDDEDTFRSLGVLKYGQHHRPRANPDIIGVLGALQPKLRPDNEDPSQDAAPSLSVQELAHIAKRISNGKYPPDAYYIRRTELMSLLSFLIIMLGGFDTRISVCQDLLEDIQRFKKNLETTVTSEISWQQIVDAKNGGMV